jgi:hypothetical protein
VITARQIKQQPTALVHQSPNSWISETQKRPAADGRLGCGDGTVSLCGGESRLIGAFGQFVVLARVQEALTDQFPQGGWRRNAAWTPSRSSAGRASRPSTKGGVRWPTPKAERAFRKGTPRGPVCWRLTVGFLYKILSFS